jgi:DNA-binding MarR family transcriptional regulator
MQEALTDNLETFEDSMHLFISTMKRPQSWSLITEMANLDIDRPAATILLVLIAQDSKICRLHDLAEHLSIEAPSVTRKVQQLESAGLVIRQQDDQDKRAYDLKATKQGHQAAIKIRNAQRQMISKVFSGWTNDERKTFVNLFERFSKDMSSLYNTKPVNALKN